MADIQTQGSEYILGTGEHGKNNLDLQHEILKKESFTQLKEAGLAQDMVVWDIGCGSGAMTEHLAKVVGGEGLVYAMDASEAQIKVAKDRIESAGYKNVRFIVGDINDVDNSKYKKADIVYSRFLLMHVDDPQKVIKIMTSLLKPGGVVSLQESSMNSFVENNNDASINKYYGLIIAYADLKGFDYNIGRKLAKICDEVGAFSKVKQYTKNYNTTDDIKKLLSQRLNELKDKFITSNLITEEEYMKLQIDVNGFLKDPKSNNSIILSEQSYILAYTNAC